MQFHHNCFEYKSRLKGNASSVFKKNCSKFRINAELFKILFDLMTKPFPLELFRHLFLMFCRFRQVFHPTG